MDGQQTFIVMDMQDSADWWEGTSKEVHQFIFNMYEDSAEFEEETEWNKFVKKVEGLNTIDELDNQLNCIDYTIFNNEFELNQWKKEIDQ
jgi:hypothetical protein